MLGSKSVAKNLLSQGYIALPLIKGDKSPFIKGWQKLDLKGSADIWENQPTDSNIGVLLGAPSNIIALDFDYDVDDLHKKIFKICGKSPVVKKGSKGGTLFFRYNKEPSKRWLKNNQVVLELLSDGRQTVLPPSTHPAGMQYIYTPASKRLEEISPSELPFLPEDFIEKMDSLFNVKASIEELYADNESVKEALYFITDYSYETWVKVGMALKSELGEEGFHFWDDWSKKDSKSYNPEVMASKWESFNRSDIKAGTLFFLAKERGYIPKKPTALFNINNAFNVIENWRRNGRPEGFTSTIEPMDRLLKLGRGELTVITGTPNSGKSEFLDYLVYNLAKHNGLKVFFVSLEKEVNSHIESFIHRYTGKDLVVRSSSENQSGINWIKKHLFFYNYMNNSSNIDVLLQQANYLKESCGLDILVLDPYFLITSQKSSNEFDNVKYICNRLSTFSKRYNVHIFLVAHPRTIGKGQGAKDGKKSTVTLYDISGGATFNNIIENGIVISREGNDMTVDIQKVRDQSVNTTGSFILTYDKAKRTFNSYETDL